MKNLSALFVLLSFVLFTRCNKEDIDSPSPLLPHTPPSRSVYAIQLGAPEQHDIAGRIIDENGVGVAGAKVRVGSRVIISDTDGFFAAFNVYVYKNHAYIKAEKQGYFPGSRSIVPTAGVNSLVIRMLSNTPRWKLYGICWRKNIHSKCID